MSIKELINQDAVALTDSSTIADATKRLLDGRLYALPVVDSDGRYLGVFSMKRLFSLLLPKAVLIDGGVSDLGFVTDPMETLCERMGEHGSLPVSEALEKGVPVAHPDTPLLEVVLHLYRGEEGIPVVDKQSGRFIGIVAGTDLLARVCKG